MGPRLGRETVHELRIHGVAGTPPEGMLDDLLLVDPAPGRCGEVPTGTLTSTWARADRPRVPVRAYSWASATSGSIRAALYLLLLPFLLANLAGWALLPDQPPGTSSLGDADRPRPFAGRIATAIVRLTGLLLTVIFTQWCLLITLDLGAYQWGVRVLGASAWVLGVGVLGAWVVIELLLVVTRLRLRPGVGTRRVTADRTDPVGYTWLEHDQWRLWSSPGTIARQRLSHHGVALAFIALVAVGMVATWADMPGVWAGALAAFAGGVIVLGVGLVLREAVSDGRDIGGAHTALSRAMPWLGRAAVLFAAVALATATLPTALVTAADGGMIGDAAAGDPGLMEAVQEMADEGRPAFLPVIRGVGLGVLLAYTVAALLAAVIGFLARDRTPVARGGVRPLGRWASANTCGLLLLAVSVGAGMGAAGAQAVATLLGRGDALLLPGPLPEALAIAFSGLGVVVGWLLAVAMALHVRHTDPTDGLRVRATTAVQRLLSGGSWVAALLTVLGIVGTAATVAMVVSGSSPLLVLQDTDPIPQLILMVALSLVAALVALAVWLWQGRRWAVVALVVLLAAATVLTASMSGDAIALWLRRAAVFVGLTTPAGLVAGKGLSALRRSSDRRTVAILWDVGTFFPRWFHPLCPPSYGDHVVTDLHRLIRAEAEAQPGRHLLLAPHSQGTVISAAAVLGLPEPIGLQRVALLTVGSPLRQFYAEFFPRMFAMSTLTALQTRLAGRWRNLLRESDPIAAPVGISGVDHVLTDDPCGRGHSRYPQEDSYRALADALLAEVGVPPQPDLAVIQQPGSAAPSSPTPR